MRRDFKIDPNGKEGHEEDRGVADGVVRRPSLSPRHLAFAGNQPRWRQFVIPEVISCLRYLSLIGLSYGLSGIFLSGGELGVKISKKSHYLDGGGFFCLTFVFHGRSFCYCHQFLVSPG
jgi:hypothetical protein